ncbi:MAG: hypothetical protein H5T98_02110 [Syntrophomonadaceae bacterium]|nr:hypothetical protein [Syntrophomonadaceae bacterium]
MLDEWIRKNREDREGEKVFFQGKKSKYLLVIIICIGLLALIWPGTRSEQPEQRVLQEANSNKAVDSADSLKAQLVAELESILSQIEGAGTVKVSLILSSDGIKTYASNVRKESRETEENDSKGGEKRISEESVSQDLAVSAGDPLLIEEKFPEVLGVLVVADGAGIPAVRERLADATATLLNISIHKVRVMSREGGEK